MLDESERRVLLDAVEVLKSLLPALDRPGTKVVCFLLEMALIEAEDQLNGTAPPVPKALQRRGSIH